jgi:uncharacterized membrane protein YkoI
VTNEHENARRRIAAASAAVLAAGGLLAGAAGGAAAQAITPDQARNTALTHLGGGTVLEVEMEREGGRLAYEVEVRTAAGAVTEVLVDASSGAVLSSAGDDADGPGDSEGPGDSDGPGDND